MNLLKIRVAIKMFTINYFWYIYALRAKIRCSRGKHFFVGVWKTDKGFCLYCDIDLKRS